MPVETMFLGETVPAEFAFKLEKILRIHNLILNTKNQ
jgi:hypothetical protein